MPKIFFLSREFSSETFVFGGELCDLRGLLGAGDDLVALLELGLEDGDAGGGVAEGWK
jgi:hypothetical protein